MIFLSEFTLLIFFIIFVIAAIEVHHLQEFQLPIAFYEIRRCDSWTDGRTDSGALEYGPVLPF